MKRISVQIEGITPLLMNSPKAMLEPQNELTQKNKKRNQTEEAEKVAYRTSKGKLYVPATAIMGTLLGASSYKKVGKFALKPLMASAVRIEPEEIILNKQAYEIDLRTVVIQRARVVKARPKISDWKIDFDIIYNDDLISDDKIIKQSLKEAGERVGILDFRPAKLGSFGMFKITKWVVGKK